MKVLVTGSHGYLGSVLVPMLLAEGHHVVGLDNLMFGQHTLAQYSGDEHFETYRVDVRDAKAVRPHVTECDAVIPLACLVGAPICNMLPVEAELLNVRAMLDLISMLSPNQLLIFPSTESVYGRQPGGLLTEDSKVAPLVSYGVQKLAIESALAGRANTIIFRMATLFGMSDRMRLDLLVNDFTWRAMRDRALLVFEAHAMRTCLHVADAARAFLHSIPDNEYWNETGCAIQHVEPGIYNVGSITLSKLSLCEAIKAQQDFHYVEAQYATDPDARDYVVSDAKLRATGYEPTVTLEQGIAELLKGYRMLDNNRFSNMP